MKSYNLILLLVAFCITSPLCAAQMDDEFQPQNQDNKKPWIGSKTHLPHSAPTQHPLLADEARPHAYSSTEMTRPRSITRPVVSLQVGNPSIVNNTYQRIESQEEAPQPSLAMDYLKELDIDPETFDQNALDMLEETLTQKPLRRWRNWFLLNSWTERCCLCCCVGYQPPAGNRHCCKSSHIRPQHNTLPALDTYTMKKMAFANNINQAAGQAFSLLWKDIFTLLLLNEVCNYFIYPHDRGPTSLGGMLLGHGNTNILNGYPTFWAGLFVLGTCHSLGSSMLMGCCTQPATPLNIETSIQQLSTHKPNSWNSTLGVLLPCPCCGLSQTRSALNTARQLLLWDGQLSPSHRTQLLEGIIHIAHKGRWWAWSQAISILKEVSYGTALADFKKLQDQGIDSATLVSLLKTKLAATRALRRLKYAYRDLIDSHPLISTTCWAHIKARYSLFTLDYALWSLGYGRTIQFTKKQLFALCVLLMHANNAYHLAMFSQGLTLTFLQNQKAQQACESKHYHYQYFPSYNAYKCAVCDGFNLPLDKIFTRKDCWSAWIKSPQIWSTNTISQFLDKIALEKLVIQDTNFNGLGLNDRLFKRIMAVRRKQPDWPNVTELSFANNRINDAGYLAELLRNSSLTFLDGSHNQLADIGPLVKVLPDTALQILNISSNNITNITPLAQLIDKTSLQYVAFAGNPFLKKVIPFVQALFYYQVKTDVDFSIVVRNPVLRPMVDQYRSSLLDLSYRQVGDILPIVQALPLVEWKGLDLSNSYGTSDGTIKNINLLGPYLPHTGLTWLDLTSTGLTDITPLANSLSKTTLTTLNVSGNVIFNITPLAHVLPDTRLTILDVSYINAAMSPLLQVLPRTQLTTLDISGNTANISELAQVLPDTQLQVLLLDLAFTRNITTLAPLVEVLPHTRLTMFKFNNAGLTNITPLAEVLPHTRITRLVLNYNYLTNITPLAHVLSDTRITELDLAGNNGIVDITPLVHVLPDTRITELDLRNRFVNVNPLFEVLPYTNLTILYLNADPTVNITLLTDVLPSTNLAVLFLYNKGLTSSDLISNITPLIDILPSTHLTTLFISGTTVNMSDLAVVLPTTKLTKFAIGGGEITDFKSLYKALPHTQLTELIMGGNNATIDMRDLAEILPKTRLSVLDLQVKSITHIEALTQILPRINLQQLTLYTTYPIPIVSSLTPFDYALFVYYTKLRVFDPPPQLTNFTRALAIQFNSSILSLAYEPSFNTTLLAEVLPRSSWETLYIANNSLKQLTPFVQALPRAKVTQLQLINTGLSNIEPLAQVLNQTNITSVELRHNAIDNLTAFTANPAPLLRHVDLSYNNITNLTPLAKTIPTLHALLLRGNPINDISPLAQYLIGSSITTLDLRDNHIANIDPLAAALDRTNLTVLYLSGNNISNITALARKLSRSKLYYLDLSNNALTDISLLNSALVTEKKISYHLWFAPILRRLPNPVQVDTISYENNCPKLTNLYLANNHIPTTAGIDFCQRISFTKIRHFSLAGNLIDTNRVNLDTCRLLSSASQPALTPGLTLTSLLVTWLVGKYFIS